ncbi:hypothetical protein ACQP00_11295 [Dactylosporangium sp. CS-047395]|uniref:hypothetical protein n=1 Tax=Dactylosporangium sp. CS-047395 TaxID=3239936 RepID=UPI003D8D4AC2
MQEHLANGATRLHVWRLVRAFAVPPPMIETSTARRAAGDWAGACAAAHVDVDLNLRRLARQRGPDLAARIRADLRHLAPDLLRWHLPRIGPDGLLRPGLTVALARYEDAGLTLVARTPPAWAAGGQRFSLTLWDGETGGRHPDRHFRLDLHRHLWDARRAGELRDRAAGDWAHEARQVFPDAPTVLVKAGARRLLLDVRAGAARAARSRDPRLPVLPHASTWPAPDLELLEEGLIEPGDLHPLVAAALAPGHARARAPVRPGDARIVDCRGTPHRIGLVGGVLCALDHDPAQLRREELLAALGGPPLPCLRAIDQAHRHPEDLDDVRARLDHGDAAGALAAVEDLLGPDALLRAGALREALETAAERRIRHGLFRAGLNPTR